VITRSLGAGASNGPCIARCRRLPHDCDPLCGRLHDVQKTALGELHTDALRLGGIRRRADSINGEIIKFSGFPTKILISGADTAGASALLDIQIPSNAGPPAHIHSREDEVYFIKSGTFQFLLDGVCLEAGPGSSVYMPKGHFHTFKNISKQPGEQLMFVYPAGIEQFFWEVHELNLKMPRDFQKLNELANTKYGINHVPNHDFHAGACAVIKALN
jgi:mannose-6-phosphate isomerase-like protein (cupin superfamily)